MSKWSDLRTRDNDLLENHQKPLRFRKLLTMNSNMQSLWHAMAITRPTRSALSDGICAQRPAALSKEKQVRQYRWFSTSDHSTTSKLWVLTNLFSKLSKNDRIFTYPLNFACSLESPKRFVKTKRQWPQWDRVFSRSHMIASDRFASSTRWFRQVKRSNNGVLT